MNEVFIIFVQGFTALFNMHVLCLKVIICLFVHTTHWDESDQVTATKEQKELQLFQPEHHKDIVFLVLCETVI
jgi:hypothetical protein